MLLTFLFSSSCAKKQSADDDNVSPVVTISNPVNNQIFNNGQPITISGTVTDNVYIAEIHIHISNSHTGALLMDVHLYPGTNSTTFNQSIIAVSGINYKIQVLAKDRSVNEGLDTILVSCN